MRDFKGMKRQRGRNRRSGGGQSGGQSNNPNRSFDSNGPEGIKVRGNAQTVYERYQQLARDATSSGDRILAENYLQHAEHYFRLLRIMQPNRPVTEIAAREGLGQGFDIDFEDETGAQAAQFAAEAARAEAQAQAQQQQQQQSQPRDRDSRDRDNREPREPREYRERNEAREGGEDRSEARGDDAREDGEGREGGRRESRRERYERRKQERYGRDGDPAEAGADPMPVIEPEARAESREEREADHMPSFLTRSATPQAEPAGEDAPAPRKRGRPKKAETVAADDEA